MTTVAFVLAVFFASVSALMTAAALLVGSKPQEARVAPDFRGAFAYLLSLLAWSYLAYVVVAA